MLFAQDAVQVSEALNPWITLITTGGFGGLVWYLVVVHMPKMAAAEEQLRKEQSSTYEELRREERGDFLNELGRQRESFLGALKDQQAHFDRLVDIVRSDVQEGAQIMSKLSKLINEKTS